MDTFLTWDVLLTYAGCVAGTIFVTEFLKKMFPKIIAQVASFAVAVLILICGHLAMGDFAVKEIPLYLINAIVVSLASNGGFDALKGAFGKTEVIQNELIVDPGNDDQEGEVYLSINEDPKAYTDGEVLQFRVKKVTQK